MNANGTGDLHVLGVRGPVRAHADTGDVEVVVTDIDGNVWAWEANGTRRAGTWMPPSPPPSLGTRRC